MKPKKSVERKVTVTSIDSEDFEFTVKIAKYVNEYSGVMDIVTFQRECLDFVDKITTLTSRAWAARFDAEFEDKSIEEAFGESQTDEETNAKGHYQESTVSDPETDPESKSETDPESKSRRSRKAVEKELSELPL